MQVGARGVVYVCALGAEMTCASSRLWRTKPRLSPDITRGADDEAMAVTEGSSGAAATPMTSGIFSRARETGWRTPPTALLAGCAAERPSATAMQAAAGAALACSGHFTPERRSRRFLLSSRRGEAREVKTRRRVCLPRPLESGQGGVTAPNLSHIPHFEAHGGAQGTD